jgi:hypothetical protein
MFLCSWVLAWLLLFVEPLCVCAAQVSFLLVGIVDSAILVKSIEKRAEKQYT